MKKIEKLLETIMDNNITILAARPLCGRSAITSELLYKYTIKKNKKTLLFSLDGNDDFYIIHLISRITNIPIETVYKYYHPCRGSSKGNNSIDRDKFMDAIEMIQKSDFIINSNLLLNCDYIDYILEYNTLEKLDLIIINGLDELIKKSKYKAYELLKKLKSSAKKYNTHILLWNNVSRNADRWPNRKIKLSDVNFYNVTKKYVDNIILLQKNCYSIKIKNYKEKNYVEFTTKYIHDTDVVLCTDKNLDSNMQ